MQMKNSEEHTTYQAEIERWRQRMEQSLRADRSWLTLAGLFWLEEGTNRFGTSPENQIVLPGASAPAYVGSIDYRAGTAMLQDAVEGVAINGQPATAAQLHTDVDTTPDLITIGDLTMLV